MLRVAPPSRRVTVAPGPIPFCRCVQPLAERRTDDIVHLHTEAIDLMRSAASVVKSQPQPALPVVSSCHTTWDLCWDREVIIMTAAHPRPDLAAYAEAARMSQPELVAALRDLLGAKLVAYLGRVSETRAVRQWAEGTRTIANPDDVERLRLAYRAARLITERDTPAVAQAWFQGLNPVLDDRAPALLLRDGELADVGPQVLAAARQFAAVG